VAELTAQTTIDEQRLALEIALLATKWTSPRSWCGSFARRGGARRVAGRSGGGKAARVPREELLREVNTMARRQMTRGSPRRDRDEGGPRRIREQLENLE